MPLTLPVQRLGLPVVANTPTSQRANQSLGNSFSEAPLSPNLRLASIDSLDVSVLHIRAPAVSLHVPATPDTSNGGTPLSLRSSLLVVSPSLRPRRRYLLRPPRVVVDAKTPGGSQQLRAARGEDAIATPGGTQLHTSRGEEASLPAWEECAICLEPLQAGETVQPMVRCAHLFHRSCVRDFVRARHAESPSGLSCPLCRGHLATTSLSDVPEPEQADAVPFDHLGRSSSEAC